MSLSLNCVNYHTLYDIDIRYFFIYYEGHCNFKKRYIFVVYTERKMGNFCARYCTPEKLGKATNKTVINTGKDILALKLSMENTTLNSGNQ